MDEPELIKARDLVDDMHQSIENGHFFEIDADDTRILARYIRELESRVVGAPKLTSSDRFKHTSRAIPQWPPEIPGYVCLLTTVSRGQETAHYCALKEARAITDLLAADITKVESMLVNGSTMEQVVDAFQKGEVTSVTLVK
jgi:hypothetical protein